MILKSDRYFNQNSYYFPAKDRQKARKLFRRAVREYYVMQRKYVIDPDTGKRTKSVFYGEAIRHEKKQKRKVKFSYTGHTKAGRPPRPEIKLLLSRLFILWGQYAKSPPTFSWVKKEAIQTEFEVFLFDLLPRLGANNVKRYVESHWRDRKVKINGV